mgnify:CR=1 FL=1
MLQPADVGDWIPRTAVYMYFRLVRKQTPDSTYIAEQPTRFPQKHLIFIDQYDPESFWYFPVTTFYKNEL